MEESCKFQLCYEQELDDITLHPEVESTLNYLSTLPVKLGNCTNGPTDHQQKKLDQLQLTRWIKPEHMIISQATGYQKPQLEIFQLAEPPLLLIRKPHCTLVIILIMTWLAVRKPVGKLCGSIIVSVKRLVDWKTYQMHRSLLFPAARQY